MLHQDQKQPDKSQSIQMGQDSDVPGNVMSPPAFQLMASSLNEAEGENDSAFQLKEGGADGHAAVTPPPSGNGNLPGQLRASMESMSGISLGDVKVNYNSSKPAQMKAHAFAQGSEIHLGAGQEKHLGHEAWHVVQQKQGRVKANTEVNGTPVNDHAGLEKEADDMGAKAVQMKAAPAGQLKTAAAPGGAPVQGRWMNTKFQGGGQQGTESMDIEPDPWQDFLSAAINAGFKDQVDQMAAVLASNSILKSMVVQALADSQQSPTVYETSELVSMVGQLITTNSAKDSEGADEDQGGDHVFGPGAEEKIADPENDIDVPKLASHDVKMLYQVFANWIRSKGISVDEQTMQQKFLQWYKGRVYTRSMIRELFSDSGGGNVMQLARSGNSISAQDEYVTKNFGKFENVSYMRDAKGNIDFSTTWGAPKAWQDPVIHGSLVELSTDVKKAGHGLMPSGKIVKITDASRSQHFAIGDRLDPSGTNRSGKYTWHHLSPEYEMVLVDMTVHAKHGHNGGVYLWK